MDMLVNTYVATSYGITATWLGVCMLDKLFIPIDVSQLLHKYACTHAHTHARTHTHAHTRTHTHAHTHTHVVRS